MPGMNGVELTAALRANYSMPIMVCTASGGAPDWRLLSVDRRRRLSGQADRSVRADRARPQDAGRQVAGSIPGVAAGRPRLAVLRPAPARARPRPFAGCDRAEPVKFRAALR